MKKLTFLSSLSRKNSLKVVIVLSAFFLLTATLGLMGCAPEEEAPEEPVTEDPEEPVAEEPEEEEVETIELTMAGLMPPESPFETEITPIFFEKIEEATDGRVQIDHYPGGTLIEGGDIFDGVARGTADLGHESLSWVEGRLPVSDLFKMSGHPMANSKAASRTFMEVVERLDLEEFQDVKVLMLFCTGPGDLHTKEPVRNLEDLEGLDIRNACGIDAPAVEALGASPNQMSHADAYEALQRGVVDGTLASSETLVAWHIAEVTEYTTLTPFLYNGLQGIVMNWDTWDSLPRDIQEAIEEVSEEVWENHAMSFFDEQVEAGLEFAVEEHDQEIITLSEEEKERWIERVDHFIHEYAEELDEQGLPGTEAKDLLFELGEKYSEKYE